MNAGGRGDQSVLDQLVPLAFHQSPPLAEAQRAHGQDLVRVCNLIHPVLDLTRFCGSWVRVSSIPACSSPIVTAERNICSSCKWPNQDNTAPCGFGYPSSETTFVSSRYFFTATPQVYDGGERPVWELWQGAFTRAPYRSAIGMDLAIVLCAAGHPEQGKNYVVRVLEFNPDFAPASRLLQHLQADPPQCKP